jgi:hypothetical protein
MFVNFLRVLRDMWQEDWQNRPVVVVFGSLMLLGYIAACCAGMEGEN